MATRAVNKTAKEGEQNARLLLSRGALSAMAIFRRAAFPSVRRWRDAPRRTRCSLQPRQHSVFRASGGGVLQVLPSAPFFFAGRAAVIWCGANPGVRPWQDLRECVLGRLVVAIFRHGAFPGARRWQNAREMRSPGVRRWRDCALMRSWPDWQWQYSRTVRSRAAIRGKFCAPCIPKVALDGKIASSRQDLRATHPKAGWLWQDLRAMHPKCPANRRRRIHRARILPGRGTFRCTGPSNHARCADLAVRRSAKPPECPQPRRRRAARAARARSPGPRNTAREAAPPSLPGQQVPPAAPVAPPPLFANTSQ